MIRIRTALLHLLCFVAGAACLTGCGSTERQEMGTPPTTADAKERTLEALMSRIEKNQDSYRSFRARCEAVVKSPLMHRPEKLQLTGELELLKPRKVRLVLRRAGHVAIRVVGDGKHYEVSMPIFHDSYSGAYGDPLRESGSRIHLMPDDLADALDLRGLFWQKPQVLKAYPACWDLTAGSLSAPVIYPPVWSIDSLDIAGGRQTRLQAQNSVLVDRRTEQIRRIDKFRGDGSLRVRIWHLNPGLVQGKDGQTVRVPGGLMIWYPSPLEGTIIRIRFTRRQVNVPIDKETFVLGSR